MRKPGSGVQGNTTPKFGVHPRPHDFPDLWPIAFGPSGEARVGRCGEVGNKQSVPRLASSVEARQDKQMPSQHGPPTTECDVSRLLKGANSEFIPKSRMNSNLIMFFEKALSTVCPIIVPCLSLDPTNHT